MKAYGRKIVLRHLQHVIGVGHEHIAALAVCGHELVLALFEGFQRSLVVALYPARLVERQRLPAALSAVLVQQTVLDYLELQLPHGTDYLAAVELVHEQLGHALVHELLNAFFQLLALHGVGVLDVFEHLGRETGQTLEVQVLALGERVANLEVACIGKTHYVAGECFVHDALFLGHKRGGSREFHHLAAAYLLVRCIALETAGAYLHESDAAAVVRVHIGVNLEHEAAEFLLLGIDGSLLGRHGAGRRRNLYEAVEQLLDAECIQSRAEEHGSETSMQVLLHLKLGIYATD